VRVHPTRAEKNGEAKFTEESCKCTPRQSKSPFLGNWVDLDGGNGYFSSFLAFVLRATTKKVVTFLGEKVHP